MKSIFKALKPHGYEQRIVDDDFEVKKPYIDIFPIQPCWKPKFDFKQNKWIETATEEEMKPVEVDPGEEGTSEIESIKKSVSDLKHKVIELEEQINDKQ